MFADKYSSTESFLDPDAEVFEPTDKWQTVKQGDYLQLNGGYLQLNGGYLVLNGGYLQLNCGYLQLNRVIYTLHTCLNTYFMKQRFLITVLFSTFFQ